MAALGGGFLGTTIYSGALCGRGKVVGGGVGKFLFRARAQRWCRFLAGVDWSEFLRKVTRKHAFWRAAGLDLTPPLA